MFATVEEDVSLHTYGARSHVNEKRANHQNLIVYPHFDMLMGYSSGCTAIHELLQIIVQVLKHQKELSVTV